MEHICANPCEILVTSVRGDYLSFRVEVDLGCSDTNPIDLSAYNYAAELWQVTRRIDESNPFGGIVRVEKVATFGVELQQDSTPPAVVLSLPASETALLMPEVPYRWDLRWYITPESVRTLAYGPLKVK